MPSRAILSYTTIVGVQKPVLNCTNLVHGYVFEGVIGLEDLKVGVRGLHGHPDVAGLREGHERGEIMQRVGGPQVGQIRIAGAGHSVQEPRGECQGLLPPEPPHQVSGKRFAELLLLSASHLRIL